MSLWASACLSYGPCARAGGYAPMASVSRVLSARVFMRASMVHMWDSRNARGRHRMNAASVVEASRVFDIRKHLSRRLSVANVHADLHGTGRDVEAAGEAPQPDQVLEAFALRHERYALGFERRLREREGDGVRDRKSTRLNSSHIEPSRMPS